VTTAVVMSCFMGYVGAILVRVGLSHRGTRRALALATHTSFLHISQVCYPLFHFNRKTAHPLFAFPTKESEEKPVFDTFIILPRLTPSHFEPTNDPRRTIPAPRSEVGGV
jgi:hypothetical protein